jgi:predicted nucleic acid-binding protein
MIRVVIDTNIFISALLQPRGLLAEVLVMSLGGEHRALGDAEIYSAYEEVIRRPRFKRSG